jgi:chaperonin GroEL (HSP60 family)
MYLSNQLKAYAKTTSGLDQYSISKFGEAFEVVPRTLAENAGLNTNELMANLNSQNSQDSKIGIDVMVTLFILTISRTENLKTHLNSEFMII